MRKVFLFIAKYVGFIVFLFIIAFPIITTHEMGHYLAMRYYGVTVAEFMVGFGPKLACFFYAGTQWCLRLIVLGGGALPTAEGWEMIEALPALSQIVIWVAGIVVNLLTVLLLATLLQWWYKRPTLWRLGGYALSTAAKFPLAFIGMAFMLAASAINLLFPRFRPRIPFGSGLVVLPREAKKTIWHLFVILILFAALVNLLPFYPLDGGRIFDTPLTFLACPPLVRGIAQKVGLGVAILIMFLLWSGQTRNDFKLISYEGDEVKEKLIPFEVSYTQLAELGVVVTKLWEVDDSTQHFEGSITLDGKTRQVRGTINVNTGKVKASYESPSLFTCHVSHIDVPQPPDILHKEKAEGRKIS